jgi:hypothetical protein
MTMLTFEGIIYFVLILYIMIRMLVYHKTKNLIFKKMENKMKLHKLYEYEHKKTQVILKQTYLSDKELEIFDIIKKVLKKHGRKTICRIAGGWVRDKVRITKIDVR